MKENKRRKYLKFIGQVSFESSTMQTDWYGKLRGSEKRLKKALKEFLAKGNNLEVEWECGGDEAILTWENDDIIRKEFNESLLVDLQIYLMNFLNLPDVGEFSLEGKGKLYLEKEDIYIECQSLMSYEGEETIDPTYSGNIKLFENKRKK